MELFLSSIFTCVSFLAVRTAGVNVQVTTIGCTVLIHWNKETHSEFYINIWNANHKDPVGISTKRSRFTYADAQPGQSCNITWTPIRINRNNKRDWEKTLREEIFVLIPRDCNIQTSYSEISSTPKTESILQQSSSEISPTQETGKIHFTALTKDRCFKVPHYIKTYFFFIHYFTRWGFTDSSGFCDVYFWVSVFAFPVVIGAVIVLTYLHIIRKFQGTKHRKQNDPQTARSAGVNVKSTCYSNDTPQYYDEVQYSLAQEIGR